MRCSVNHAIEMFMDRMPCSSSHLSQASCLHPIGSDLASGFLLLSRIWGRNWGAALASEQSCPLQLSEAPPWASWSPTWSPVLASVLYWRPCQRPQVKCYSSGWSQLFLLCAIVQALPRQCLSLGFFQEALSVPSSARSQAWLLAQCKTCLEMLLEEAA